MKADDTLSSSRTDWHKLENLTDKEIDYSDIPPLSESFFGRASLVIPAADARTLVRLDDDVMEWFKAQGDDYLARINQVLRAHIQTQDNQ